MSYNSLIGLGTHSEDAALNLHLKLQDTTGTTAIDSSSNGNDGTIVGMGTDPDVDTGPNSYLPSAFRFDVGTTPYVSLPLAGQTGNDRTLCFWAKADSNSVSSGGSIIDEITLGGSGRSFFPFSDGNIYCGIYRTNTSSAIARVSVGSIGSVTAWRFCVVKTENVTNGWKFRADGVDEATANGVALKGNGTYRLGYNGAEVFNGVMAGVINFTRKLSDAEDEELRLGPEPLNTAVPTLSITTSSWSGTIGTWDDQDNGTVTYVWELRDADDDAMVESGSGSSPSGSGSYSGDYYLWVRASNSGGFDSGEDSVSTDETASGGGAQTINIGRATETESGRSVVVSNPNLVAIGRATETEVGRSLVVINPNMVTLGRATETESGKTLVALAGNSVLLGRATETEVGRSLVIVNPNTIAVGRATETETAKALSVAAPQTVSLGRASETESGRNLTIRIGSGSLSAYYYYTYLAG